jgi:hypothetical protein
MPEDQLLASLIANAVKEAIQPFKERITALEKENANLKQDLAALGTTQSHLSENQLIQLRLINDLRQSVIKSPQPMQKDRAEILRALLVANGGKMLAKDARQKMHLGENRFSELLKSCDFLEVKPLHSDKRRLVIILKSELLPWK